MTDDSASLTSAQADRRNPATRVILVIFTLVLLAAVMVGLSFAMQEPETSGRIPSQISGLRLLRTLTGQAALADLRQMHGQDFPLTGGYVAYYEKSVTIWVGDTDSEEQAQSLISRMTQKIGAGNRVFTNLQPSQIAGQKLYSVEGQGQKHFFYAVGKRTVWVAAPRGGEDAFIQEALKVIR